MAVLAATLLTLAGCATLSSGDSARLPIQYGTLKLIEQSEAVSSEAVIERVTWLRETVDTEESIVLSELRERLFERLDLTGLSPADRFLLQELASQVETSIELDVESGRLDPEARARLDEILNWIEVAARMAG